MEQKQQQNNELPFTLSVVVSEIKCGDVIKPCVILRRCTTEPEIIKKIITAAIHKIPLIVMPICNSEIRTISSLIDKGILYREPKNGQYYFTF